MITKRDILKMVKTIHRHDRGLPPRRLIYPAREWGIGMLMSTLLLLAVTASAAITFLALDALETQVVPPSVQTVAYDTATAERAREVFQDRSATFAAYTAAASVVSEPVEVGSSTPATATSTPATNEDESADDATPVETTTSNAPLTAS